MKTMRWTRLMAFVLCCAMLLSLLPVGAAAKNLRSDATAILDGEYVIAANVDGVYYAMNTTFFGKIAGAEITVTDGCVSEEDAEGYKVTLTKTEDGYAIYNGTKYLAYATGTNLASDVNPYGWNIEAGTKGSWRITSAATPDRGLIYRAGSYNVFGGYRAELVTDTSEYYDIELLHVGGIVPNGTYVIAANAGGTYYAMNNTLAGYVADSQIVTPVDGKISAQEAENCAFKLTVTAEGYTIAAKDGYLAYAGSSMLMSIVEEPYYWTIDEGLKGSYRITPNTETGDIDRGLLFNNVEPYRFACYFLNNVLTANSEYLDLELLPVDGEIETEPETTEPTQETAAPQEPFEIADGRYVIAAKVDGVYYAMSNAFGNAQLQTASEIEVIDGKVPGLSAKDFAVEVRKGENGHTIFWDGKYLAYSGTSNRLNGDSDPYEWELIPGANGSVKAIAPDTYAATTLRALIYSVQSGLFAAYAEQNSVVGVGYYDLEFLPVDGELELPKVEINTGRYVIAAKIGEAYYALSNDFETTNGKAITVTDGCVSGADAVNAHVLLTADENGVSIFNGTKYLSCSDVPELTVQDEPYYWTLREGLNGSYRFDADVTNGLLYHATSNTFGGFALSNVTKESKLYYDIELLPVNGEIPGFTPAEVASGSYVIAAKIDGVYYALSSDFKAMIKSEEITVTDGCVNGADAVSSHVILSVDENGVSISNGTKYLGFSSSPNLAAQDEPYYWTLRKGANGSYRLDADGTNGLLYYANSNVFGGFVLANAISGNVLYYDIELLPVNGDIPGFTPVKVESGTYVIAAKLGDQHFAMYNHFKAQSNYEKLELVNGKVSGKIAKPFAVEIQATQQGYTIFNGTSYLAYANDDTFAAGEEPYYWQIVMGVNGTYRFVASTSKSEGLVFVGADVAQFRINPLANVTSGNEMYFDLELLSIEGEIAQLPHKNIPSGEYAIVLPQEDGDYSGSCEVMSTAFGPTIESVEASDKTTYAITIVNTENGYLIHNGFFYLGYQGENCLYNSREPFYWWITEGVNGSYRITPAEDPDRCLAYHADSHDRFSIYPSELVTEGSQEFFDLELIGVSSDYTEAPQQAPECFATRTDTDIILILDHSYSMYEPYSNNYEYLARAVDMFTDEAFADNNMGNNAIAIVQYDLLARAWNGSAVLYNYSMLPSDYNGALTYAKCFMKTKSDVMNAYKQLMPVYTFDQYGGSTVDAATNTMGGLKMAEIVASLRPSNTTRDLMVVMFTDGVPTARYLTASQNWSVDNDGVETSAWEYMRALEAGESLRQTVDKYKNCESTIYNVALFNSETFDEENELVADCLMSNIETYQWTYDDQFDTTRYVDLTGDSSQSDRISYISNLRKYFTKHEPWADQYYKLAGNISDDDITDIFFEIYNETVSPLQTHCFEVETDEYWHIMTCTNCGLVYEDSHHVSKWTTVKEPTCSEYGEEMGYCYHCNAIVTDEIATLPHTNVTISETASTCSVRGVRTLQCTVCGHISEQSLALLPHSYEETSLIPSTCSTRGERIETCTECGATLTTTLALLPHSYEETSLTPSTCSTRGTRTETCTECGYIKTTTLALAAHSYKETSITPSTCTTSGKLIETCTECGLIKTTTLALALHNYEETSLTPPTCTANGKRIETCTECGKTKESTLTKLSHTFVETSYTPPTCTSQGVKIETCSGCSLTRETKTNMLAHTYKRTSTTPSTCVTAGYDLFNCINCGAEKKVPLILADHDYEETTFTQPTCEDAGLRIETCSVCGDVVETVIAPYGHAYMLVSWTPPACLTGGSKLAVCDYCGDEWWEQYDPLGHDYEVTLYPPTCAEIGREVNTCKLCGDTYVKQLPMEEHVLYTVEHVAPTCTTDGYRILGCENCSYLEKTTLAATGHTCQSAITSPTCTEAGYTTYTCTVCGESYVADEVAASGHSYIYTEGDEKHTVTCENCDLNEENDHEFVDGTCICGASEVSEPIPDPELKFNMNIVAGAEMVVNYNFMASIVSKYEDFYLEVRKNVAGGEPIVTTFGITQEHTAMGSMNNPVTGAAIMYNAAYSGIAAKEMGDNFATTLYAIDADGKLHCGATEVRSIKDFLIGKLEAEASGSELKTMAVDMLRYGAAAQINFGYDVENLVTADLSEAQLAFGTSQIPKASDCASESGSGANVKMNITVNSKVELALSCIAAGQADPAAVKCVITDSEGKVLSELATVNIGGVMYSAVYDNVGARQMRDVISATFYGADGAVISKTVSWSVESYVAQVRANSASTAPEIAMVNAMLTYGDAVAAYMSSTNQ